MRTLCNAVAHVAWALWLGGLVSLFIFVGTLFSEDHALAAQTAPRLFHVFERYQLALAAVALLSAICRRTTLAAVLFCLASVGAVVSPLMITPRIMELQRLGQTHTAQFATLHGRSMMVYSADTLLVLGAGLAALKRK
jgi:hypothetical protein